MSDHMEIGELLAELKARGSGILGKVAKGFLVEEARGKADDAPGKPAPREKRTRLVQRVSLDGDDQGSLDPTARRVFRLVGNDGSTGAVVVGRGESADIAIESTSVSATHAVFMLKGDTWSVEDKGSSNGTFVDGDRLAPGKARVLEPATAIRFGPEARFTFFGPDELEAFVRGLEGLLKGAGASGPADGQIRMSAQALDGVALPDYLDDDDDSLPPVDDDE